MLESLENQLIQKNWEPVKAWYLFPFQLFKKSLLWLRRLKKKSACNSGEPGSIPGLRRFPWRRKWQPTPVFSPWKSHGQRSFVGYSPQVAKIWTRLSDITFTFQLFKILQDKLDISDLSSRKWDGNSVLASYEIGWTCWLWTPKVIRASLPWQTGSTAY